jgi:hypothetical protein
MPALATGGPLLWLFDLGTIGAYAVGWWGDMVAMALRLLTNHPWLRHRRRVGPGSAYGAPVGSWRDQLRWSPIRAEVRSDEAHRGR